MSEWLSINSAPEDTVIRTKIDDGGGPRNECDLRKRGNLWFTPDMTMYVYYRPTHWKPK